MCVCVCVCVCTHFYTCSSMSYDKLFDSLYYNVESPIAYTSRANIFQAAKKQDSTITRSDVTKWFQKQLAPTIHRPIRKNFPRNRTIVKGVQEQYQCDLADVSNIKEFNDGYTFLLTCVDCFSRYAWVCPVKNKSGPVIAKALQSILDEKECKRLQTDMGKEFLNRHVNKLLTSRGIELWISKNEVKATLVERFNQTLKNRMYKYFTASNTARYVESLPHMVDGYNHTVHRSTGFTPTEVDSSNSTLVRRRLYTPSTHGERRRVYKFALGDHVRLSKKRGVFARGYTAGWTTEVFRIIGRRNDIGVRLLYEVEDLTGEAIKGQFYSEELQRVEIPADHRIEKIIRTRKSSSGSKEHFVKWQGWGDKFNTWISAEDFV